MTVKKVSFSLVLCEFAQQILLNIALALLMEGEKKVSLVIIDVGKKKVTHRYLLVLVKEEY
jgi:hypothetical protein